MFYKKVFLLQNVNVLLAFINDLWNLLAFWVKIILK